MTTPNIDWVNLPETSLFVPQKIGYGDGAADMAVLAGRKATDTLVWVPRGVLLVQARVEMAGQGKLVSVGITQNGKRASCIWLNNPKTGDYTARVIVYDPKARLYVTQNGFTTNGWDTKVGVTVIPLGTIQET